MADDKPTPTAAQYEAMRALRRREGGDANEQVVSGHDFIPGTDIMIFHAENKEAWPRRGNKVFEIKANGRWKEID